LKLNLSERKLRWIFSRNAEEKFEELFNDLKISSPGREKIKELFFNYYVSHCFEKYFKKLKLAPNLVGAIKERIFQVKEIEEQINSIIDENSIRLLNHVNYVQIDTALKKARSLIRERLLGYDRKENGYHLDQLEKTALILKNYFFSLSFQKGQKEHISANNLILNLYKYYSGEGPVYLPKIEKTLSWFNRNFDLGKDLKIQKFNSNSLRKRIKDLKKKENSPQENHLLRKATLSSYLYSDLAELK
jgi:hypothetical protein